MSTTPERHAANRRRRYEELNGHRQLPRGHAPFDLAALLAVVNTNRPATIRAGLDTVAWENAALGLDRGSRRRYERLGLTPTAADRLAIRAGYHPAQVWGHAWWADAHDFAVTGASA